MLQEADNVINTYHYPNLLTAICKLAPVFVVKVSRPYFLTRLQGACEKFGVWGRDYMYHSFTYVGCAGNKMAAILKMHK